MAAVHKKFNIIVKTDCNFGISKNGVIPWLNDPVENDTQYFKKITTEKSTILIMGKNTYGSLPQTFNKMNRKIVVVSSTITSANIILEIDFVCSTLNDALKWCNSEDEDVIFVCGGSMLYSEAFYHPLCGRIYYKKSNNHYECDNFFRDFEFINKYYTIYKEMKRINTVVWVEELYYERKYDEEKYLFLMKRILDSPIRSNRTGVNTHSLFAEQIRYSLDGMVLPLITSKKMSFNLIYSELLWFIRGDTNIDFLKQHNNHIWDGNTSREFLDSQSLSHFKEGELGAGYGWNWRNFGGELGESVKSGIDQLKLVINSIKNEPFSRRHVITAWNPGQLSQVALPPCHLMMMFYVSGKYELSCHVIMRSNDMFLGHPFNIASYGLLTHMIAYLCGMKAKELVITMNDCHIYESHRAKVEEQLNRTCYGFPSINFKRDDIESIDDFGMDDIEVVNYYCEKPLVAKMVV